MDDPSRSRDDAAHDTAREVDADLVELSRELRRLARHVTRDEAAADDLVQDAWLAALESKPGHITGMSAWLRGVVRNIARRKSRRARAREDAERMASAEESDASEQELVERISTYRALRDRVDELREPSRTVVRMRYFDQRSPTEIAAELGRPLETVRTQLQRGLAELRDSVSRRQRPDRHAWAVALLAPFRRTADPSRANHAARWFAAASVVAIALLAWRFTRSDPQTIELAELASRPTVPSETANLVPATDPPRDALAAVPPETPALVVDARRLLEVRVVDPEGTSVPGATVVLTNVREIEVARGTTDAGGSFALDVTDLADVGPPILAEGPSGILVEAFGMGWSTSPLVVMPCGDGTTVATLALGGRAQRVVGRVLGPGGQPLPAVVIGLEAHVPGLRPDADGRLYMESPPQAIPDAEGNFVLEHLPRREHRYVVESPGFPAARGVIAGDEDELRLDVTLSRGAELRGRVVRADGHPPSAARVWSTGFDGMPSTAVQSIADESGAYVLTGLGPGPRYVFACDGAEPTWCASAAIVLADAESAPWSPTLQHVEPLIVRVEAADGTPIAGAPVLLRLPQAAAEAWTVLDTTGSSGRIVFQHRPPVALECGVFPPGPGAVPRLERIDAGAVGEFVVRLADASPPQPVRARVVGADGGLLVGARVVALGVEMTVRREAAIDATTGEIVDLELAPGAHRLHVVGPLGAFDAGVVQVVAGEPLVLALITAPRVHEVGFDWTLAPSTGTWTLQGVGHVAGAAEGLTIGELAPGMATRTLWPGSYHMVGDALGGSRSSVRFEVGAGEANHVVVR